LGERGGCNLLQGTGFKYREDIFSYVAYNEMDGINWLGNVEAYYEVLCGHFIGGIEENYERNRVVTLCPEF
jgi:hypothetical protein